jgi:uncharacterized membrane protein YccC
MERKQNVAREAHPSASEVILHGIILSLSCAISNWAITHLLASAYSISRYDDLLGGMWAVVSTLFVDRYSQTESVHIALSRMVATSVSFALCLVYLAFLPFHVWGMAGLIGIGTVAVTLIGRPDDAIPTGITIAVIMVVAELNPYHAWREPLLRLADTAVGVVFGVAAAWISTRLSIFWKTRERLMERQIIL